MPLVSGFLFPLYHKIIENEKACLFASAQVAKNCNILEANLRNQVKNAST